MPLKRTVPGPGEQARSAVGKADKTDAALLAEAAGGDAESYRALVRRHLSLVLAIARRMLRDDAEAEDVAQEAMLRLWRNAAKLQIGEAGVKPWLRRVTSNLCIDAVRSGKGVIVMETVPEVAVPASQLRRLSEKELSARVDVSLKELPERQRLALVLFHFEGMSQSEVGRTMGVSDEAVESLLARARRGLKVLLEDEWRQLLREGDD